MTDPIETEIRALVRELLREMVPPASRAPGGRADVRPVRIDSDADLAAFASRVLDIARDPAQADAVRSGRIRFALEGRAAPAAGDDPSPARPAQAASAAAPAPVQRIDAGAVTEKVVGRAAASGARLVLGPRAVLTPLAREAARKHGVGIERAT